MTRVLARGSEREGGLFKTNLTATYYFHPVASFNMSAAIVFFEDSTLSHPKVPAGWRTLITFISFFNIYLFFFPPKTQQGRCPLEPPISITGSIWWPTTRALASLANQRVSCPCGTAPPLSCRRACSTAPKSTSSRRKPRRM